jgi:membrane associated rhomboid family serine protease
MGVIPLTDASRRPTRFPVITASIILINALVFVLELFGGEAFVTKWSLVPADISAGNHLITI